MKLSKAYAAMLLAVISGTTMAAGSATANFQATATLNNACTVSSSNVDFGVIDATHNQGQGNITAHCTKGTTYNINVSAGTSGSYAARSMKAATSGNTDVVLYNLYTDTSYAAAKVWKDSGWGMGSLSQGNGNDQTYTLYGQVANNQYLVRPDSYSDNLTVTISY